MTDGLPGIPWGSEVRIASSPGNVCLGGATGTLCHPDTNLIGPIDPTVVALFKCNSIHWVVRAGEGWGFALVERPAAVTEGDWGKFARRCEDNVRSIREGKDDGLFAKLYAADVGRLLRVLDRIERRDSLERAFEDTK